MNITGSHHETPEQYARKKTVAQGFMDTALLAANTAQLKVLLDTGDPENTYFAPLLGLLITSMSIQVLVALLLAMVYSANLFDENTETEPEKEHPNTVTVESPSRLEGDSEVIPLRTMSAENAEIAFSNKSKETHKDINSKAKKRVRLYNNIATLLMVVLAFVNIIISSLGLNATGAPKTIATTTSQ